jgi:hypothetical protein
MKNTGGTIHQELSEIEYAIASAVIDVCQQYVHQQTAKRHLYGDVVHATAGKALLYAGAKFIAEAIGQTDAERAVEPVEQCLRRYWHMADCISKQHMFTPEVERN